MLAVTPSSNLRPQRVRTAVGTASPARVGGDFFVSNFIAESFA